MKKKVIIASMIVLFLVVFSGLFYHHHEKVLEQQKIEQEQKKEKSNSPKPTDYCLITYQQSKDSGKNWHTVIINSGQKPIFKAQCWKKYIHILDGFKASINDNNGLWHSKLKNGVIIAHPSMHFSDKPFNAEHTTTSSGSEIENSLQDDSTS